MMSLSDRSALAMSGGRSRIYTQPVSIAGFPRLCGPLELLEPDRQPVAIRTILKPSRPVDQCSGDPFETEFKKRTIVNFEQPVRDMDAEIGVDPDQMSIEGPHGGSWSAAGRSRPQAVLTARPRP
jgi:hypothetical protein